MKRKKIVAIIQARMGSTRLPGKVLLPILGKPMLWHIINRVNRVRLIDQIVVTTSKNKKDNKLEIFCKKNSIEVFRGSEKDVLSRYYQTAAKYQADIIVRFTGDCPLIDPEIVTKVIKKFLGGNYDHVGIATGAGVANKKEKKYPDGLDCEVFSFNALKNAHENAKNHLEREHVTMFIWKRPGQFKIGELKSPKDYSMYRFTVDHPEDLEFIKKIYQELYPKKANFVLEDIIRLITNNPDILVNQIHIGSEGYEKLHRR